MRKPSFLFPLLLLVCLPAAADTPLRPVNTYSIVARDAETGELGVAVQSHWFSVGSLVLWAEPGVGAVATQSFVDPAYGPLGLHLMRSGKSASQALEALISVDEHANVRQVGMVDAEGGVANFTGDMAIIEHCDVVGDDYAVQANLMWKPTVCEAMAAAFAKADGDLGERLMAALEAGEGEGGDIRGKQSAALLVVSDDRSQPAWGGRVYDLRVEDHAEPLLELSPDALALAETLVRDVPLPRTAVEDALHVAIATVHGMDYLLTWNFRHIANAMMRYRIERVCRSLGYEPPIICTPQELLEE